MAFIKDMKGKEIVLMALSEKGTCNKRVVLIEKVSKRINVAMKIFNELKRTRQDLADLAGTETVLLGSDYKAFLVLQGLTGFEEARRIIDDEKNGYCKRPY